jgi:hypothetical protein
MIHHTPPMSWHQARAAGLHALPYDVVGYTYRADVWCGPCVVRALTVNPGNVGHRDPGPMADPETHLDVLARVAGIDRTDERTYDSDEFPKIIFRDSAADYAAREGQPERCTTCGGALTHA